MFQATGIPTLTPTLRRLTRNDLPEGRRFAAHLSFEDVHLRFGIGSRDLARLAEKLLLAERADSESYAGIDDAGEIAGIGNLVQTAPRQAEFGLVVRPDRKRRGLGSLLLHRLMLRARQKGVHILRGWVLAENRAMIALARKQGAVFGQSVGSQIELLFNLSVDPFRESRLNDPRTPPARLESTVQRHSMPLDQAA